MEENNLAKSREEEEEEEEGGGGGGGGEEFDEPNEEDKDEHDDYEDEEYHQKQQGLTDYEKQRAQRIKENAAKLAALNLPSLASPFQNPLHRSKKRGLPGCPRPLGRRKNVDGEEMEEDDDYRPSDNGSDSETEDSDKDKAQPKGKCFTQDQDWNGDEVEDQALKQALALSLEAFVDMGKSERILKSTLDPSDNGDQRKGYNNRNNTKEKNHKDTHQISGSNNMRKRHRKGWKDQLQFTYDDIATFFSLIDEQGKGMFSVTELEHIACSHDFTWSEQEIFDMINIFDSNKDGQLDLPEFRAVFVLGNMMKAP